MNMDLRAAPLPPLGDGWIDRAIARFGLRREPQLIGEGSTCRVYLCTVGEEGTLRALKAMPIRNDPNGLRPILDEIAAGASVMGCPNAVQLLDWEVDPTNGEAFLLEEYCMPLHKYRRAHSLDAAEVFRLGLQICDALEQCRERCLAHLDVQPRNIFHGADERFKLGDFSSALHLSRLAGEKNLRGTLAYMAPEVYSRREYSIRSDLYSLALVLYCLLNGNRLPFTDELDAEEAIRRRLAGAELPPARDAGDAFNACLSKAFNPDPAERFASPEEMRAWLHLCEKELSISGRTAHVSPKPAAPRRERPSAPAEDSAASCLCSHAFVDFDADPFATTVPPGEFDADPFATSAPVPGVSFDADSFAKTIPPAAEFDAGPFATTAPLAAAEPHAEFDADPFATSEPVPGVSFDARPLARTDPSARFGIAPSPAARTPEEADAALRAKLKEIRLNNERMASSRDPMPSPPPVMASPLPDMPRPAPLPRGSRLVAGIAGLPAAALSLSEKLRERRHRKKANDDESRAQEAESGSDRPPEQAAPSAVAGQKISPAAKQAASSDADQPVQFSVVAPKQFHRDAYTMLDVFMYEDAARSVVERALAEGGMAESRSGRLLAAAGTRVRVVLSSPDLALDDSEESGVWAGDHLRFSFAVWLPGEYAKSQILFSASIYFDGVLVTRLKFIASCASASEQRPAVARQDICSAFISYSSRDRGQVASIVQGMRKVRPDMNIFWDLDSLTSGDYWDTVIKREIDARDVLYLCWSHFARESKHVEEEWRYALDRKGLNFIEPIPFEPSELCPPPKELASKHFNDRLLYFTMRQQREAQGTLPPEPRQET